MTPLLKRKQNQKMILQINWVANSRTKQPLDKILLKHKVQYLKTYSIAKSKSH